MAVRLALGATRGRLRRQVLMESVLLGLGGGALGAFLSLWATQALSSMHLPAPVPLNVRVNIDWRVDLYIVLISAASGLLLGIGPAWAASRPSLAKALKGEDAFARAGRRWNLRNVLVVAQIAMSLTTLSVTGLFLRSPEHAATLDLGFRPGTPDAFDRSRLNGYTPERTSLFLADCASAPRLCRAGCGDAPMCRCFPAAIAAMGSPCRARG
jgi:hypothetical protein